jgi:hypothetical protein
MPAHPDRPSNGRMDAVTARSWALALAGALLVIGLLAYARGTDHHRGDDVGAHGAAAGGPAAAPGAQEAGGAGG